MTPEEINELKQRLSQMEGQHMAAFMKAIPPFEAFHAASAEFLATNPFAFGKRKALKAEMRALKEEVHEVEVRVSAAYPEAYSYLPELDCTIPEYKVIGLFNDSSMIAGFVVFILAFFWGRNEGNGDIYAAGRALCITAAIMALTVIVPMLSKPKDKKK